MAAAARSRNRRPDRIPADTCARWRSARQIAPCCGSHRDRRARPCGLRFASGAKNASSLRSSTGMWIQSTRRPDAATNRIGEFDCLTEIVRLETRPAAERAEAEVIAERHLRRNVRREVAHLGQVALDRARERKPRDAAVGILHLGRAVPLDGKLAGGNFFDDFCDLGTGRRLVARPDLVEIVAVRENARRQARC